MFASFLREEGYVPRLDNDGDVVFKYQGLTFVLFASENDQEFFRMGLPNFWRIESEDERQQALAAAAVVNAKLKVVKIFPVKDNLWASAEMFIDPIESFTKIFDRTLQLLRTSVFEFKAVMLGEREGMIQ